MRAAQSRSILERARPLQPRAEAVSTPAAAPAATGAVGRWEWTTLLLAIWVQQAAFIQVLQDWSGGGPDLAGAPGDPSASNPLNFGLTMLSLVAVAALAIRHLPSTLAVVRRNPLVIATTVLVFASALWSFDPGLTARRAGTYGISVLLAIYLVSRFDFAGIVRILAVSTTVPGACSVAYALIDPFDAYMHGAELEGSLRGVYAHKNQFANVMAIGFLLQLYQSASARSWRHWGLALMHGGLVIRAGLVLQAHSAASAASVMMMAGSLGLYYLWRFSRQLGAAVTALAAAAVGGAVLFAESGDAAFQLLGRDATLTGRTDLWPLVTDEILDRMWVGWGYSAFWQTANEDMMRIWSRIGWEAPHSHNGFLEIALDLGVLGVIAAAALLLSFGANIAGTIRRRAGLEAWVYLTFLVYTLINNMIEITIMRIQEFAWFTFLVFLMASAARKPAAAPRAAPGITARARPIAAS